MDERHRLGLLLGRTGWQPQDVDKLVFIPAGEFIYGKGSKTAIIDAPFWIGAYPVTNGQFARFVNSRGYDNEKWWSKKGWKYRTESEWQYPKYWQDNRFSNPLFPVVGVSLYEAEAYCCWLNGQLRQKPQLYGFSQDEMTRLTDYQLRLSTNKEWERAARGMDGSRYPWGDTPEPDATVANVGISWPEREPAGTTPVIMFPQGARIEGEKKLWDMAGNVWEWTGEQGKEDDLYYIRGGSWYITSDFARCSFRYRNHPDYRINNTGFRVVFSLAAGS